MEPWNFGSRTIKGKVAAKRSLDKTASQIKAETPAEGGVEAATAAVEAPAVDLTETVASPVRRVPPKKSGGVRKGTGSKATGKKPAFVQICRDCGQVQCFCVGSLSGFSRNKTGKENLQGLWSGTMLLCLVRCPLCQETKQAKKNCRDCGEVMMLVCILCIFVLDRKQLKHVPTTVVRW